MNRIQNLVCNKCGKNIPVINEVPREDYISVNKEWGYFSEKDKTTYNFIMCEKCVDDLVADFVVPVVKKETIEL